MSRDWLLYLDDIVESAEKVEQFVKGRTYEAFIADKVLFDAVLFNLQVIGEAAKCLPDVARTALPDVDWSGAARFRDFVAHHYFSVDPAIVWDIVQNHSPAILTAARTLKARFDVPSQ